MKKAWSTTLQLDLSQVDGYPCMRLRGEGGLQGARALEGSLMRLIDRGQKRLVLDTRSLRFLDLCCCQALETVVRRLEQEGGLMVVVDQSLPVERTLKLLSVEHFIPIVPTISQATSYLDYHH